ncbi:hypothetical protein M758_3G081600 [Ceratodon purpureus]|nr:hypothetical protein M758_3G081600 [Ceratodon purpureus]
MHERDDDHSRRQERQVETNPPILARQQLRLRHSSKQHALHHNKHPNQMPHLLPHKPGHRSPPPHSPLQQPIRPLPILIRQLQPRMIPAVKLQHVLPLHSRRVIGILRVHLRIRIRPTLPLHSPHLTILPPLHPSQCPHQPSNPNPLHNKNHHLITFTISITYQNDELQTLVTNLKLIQCRLNSVNLYLHRKSTGSITPKKGEAFVPTYCNLRSSGETKFEPAGCHLPQMRRRTFFFLEQILRTC